MNKQIKTPECINHAIIQLLIISIFLVGCTSFVPVYMDSTTVQEKIRSGNMISVGDRVKIITKDGSSHILTVTAINEQVIKGDTGTQTHVEGIDIETTSIEIPINEINQVAEEEVSEAKTVAGAAGLSIAAMFIFLAAATAAAF